MGSFAQTKVSGKVIDKTTNRPIEGVNIILEKSKRELQLKKTVVLQLM